MPHSDSGRAAARGWSEGNTENCHSSVSYRGIAFGARNVRLKIFHKGRSHHPGAGVGPPSRAIARPSSAEEGNQNVHSSEWRTFGSGPPRADRKINQS